MKHMIKKSTVINILPLVLLMTSVALPALGLGNPFGTTDPEEIVERIIMAILRILGPGALLMLVWGGTQIAFSAGDKTRLENGKKTIVWAVTGLVLVFSSYAIFELAIDAIS